MKNLFLILAVFSLALLIGCQENMINEPAGSLDKSDDNFLTTNTLKLNNDVRDPFYGMCKLTGRVTYALQVVNATMNPIGLEQTSVQITMDAELNDLFGMAHLEWRIQGRSNDVLYVSEEGIQLLEKTYPITNRTDLVLLVNYLVTTEGVGIATVNLVPLEK